MAKYKFQYLVHIQYLGFRFHGWQKQPDVKTVHEMVDKTLSFVLGDITYKTMGTSRTDAKVSAEHSAFQLFMHEAIPDLESFLELLNSNFPFDIIATEVEPVDDSFNVLQSSKEKEYHYYFASGQKGHPYSSPFVYSHLKALDVQLMMQGAKLFEGKHDFRGYCTQPKENTNFLREVTRSEVVENDGLQANFFPDKVFIYKVRSAGFLRNQVRLMMGHLLQLGSGDIQLSDIELALKTGKRDHRLNSTAPASGLHLAQINFQ